MDHNLPAGIPPIPEKRWTISEVRRMPSFSGVYLAYGDDGVCHYVGESKDVTARVGESRPEISGRRIAVVPCDPIARKRIECYYIGLLDPPGNSQSTRRGKPKQLSSSEFSAATAQLVAEWLPVFRHYYPWAATCARTFRETVYTDEEEVTVAPDISCGGRNLESVGPGEVFVSFVPWANVGQLDDLSLAKVRRAAILGYSRTSLIVIGRPERYFGVFVTNRHKGCAEGWTCDEFLHPSEEWEGEWCPDEHTSLYDPRQPYNTKVGKWRLDVRTWDKDGISGHVYCSTWGGESNGI
jgi:hypothetical protein